MMNYHNKIMPYLDGSMSPEEKSEFEAFVHTHPEFESVIREKEGEIQVLKSLIPSAAMTDDSRKSLETEVKTSIFHLLKEEPKNFWAGLKDRMEEWSSR